MAAGAQPVRREDQGAIAGKLPAEPPRLSPLKELQLVDRYRAGGPRGQEAIAELIRAYQRRVFSVCMRMVRNQEDASDLTQDVLIKIIEGLPSYNGQSKLSTWVIRVTINCCLSHIRKQKLRAHESLDAAAAAVANAGEGGRLSHTSEATEAFSRLASRREPSPEQRIQQDQTKALLVTALSGLDADMRAILVLRDMQDLDYQQLAEVLEIPIGTVKSRLFRARAALRQAVESGGAKAEI